MTYVKSLSDFFADRFGVLATMHQKERVIAPVITRSLGIELIVPPAFDTDQFGTFTREVKRPGDQIATARLKAEHAMQLTGCSIGLASEGSFGPHPAFPWLPCNREIVIFLDRDYGLEIMGEALSTTTNFAHQTVNSLEEAQAFAAKVGFPAHGLVVRVGADEDCQWVKGIVTEAELIVAVRSGLTTATTVQIETDMRAMYNPTRMQVIQQATEDLVEKISRMCPDCGFPGFSIVERKPGLACMLCGSPTSLLRSVVYQCQQCDFQQEQLFPSGIKFADPANCPYCNP